MGASLSWRSLPGGRAGVHPGRAACRRLRINPAAANPALGRTAGRTRLRHGAQVSATLDAPCRWSGQCGRQGTVIAALSRPSELGLPFASWTLDRLVAHLGKQGIGMKRSRVGEVLLAEGLKWRQKETWFGARADPEFTRKRGQSSSSTPARPRAASSSASTRWGRLPARATCSDLRSSALRREIIGVSCPQSGSWQLLVKLDQPYEHTVT